MKKYIAITLLVVPLIGSAKSELKGHSVWHAKHYKANSSEQYKRGVEAVELFNLKGDEKVLDIGCRNGSIAALCAEKLTEKGSLVAIDPSSSMIKAAQKDYESVANSKFIVEDVTTMSYDATFDFIYSLFTLHWVEDQERAMQNIAKALKSGGRAVLYISSPTHFNQILKESFYEVLNSPEWEKYRDVLDYGKYTIPKEMWIEYAERNGLEVVEQGAVHDTTTYEQYEAFKKRQSAYGVVPYIIHMLGNDEGALFVEEYLQKIYLQCSPSLEEPMQQSRSAMILTLQKPCDKDI